MKLKSLNEEYDYLDNVSLNMYIPLFKETFVLPDGTFPEAKKIAKDLFQDDAPHGIDPMPLDILRATFLTDNEVIKFATDNPELGGGGCDGLLITTFVVDLRDFIKREIQMGSDSPHILRVLKIGGVDRKVFLAAKEWLLENYESTPQAQLDLEKLKQQGFITAGDVDQWPAPKLTKQEIDEINNTANPDFDLDWH